MSQHGLVVFLWQLANTSARTRMLWQRMLCAQCRVVVLITMMHAMPCHAGMPSICHFGTTTRTVLLTVPHRNRPNIINNIECAIVCTIYRMYATIGGTAHKCRRAQQTYCDSMFVSAIFCPANHLPANRTMQTAQTVRLINSV